MVSINELLQPAFMFFFLIIFLSVATRLRRFLLVSVRDAILVSFLCFFLLKLMAILVDTVEVKEYRPLYLELRDFLHLHQVSFLLAGSALVSLLLWRWSSGKTMVSKPGFASNLKDSTKTSEPYFDVNIINLLPNLVKAVHSVLSPTSKHVELDQITLLMQKLDTLYQDIHQMKNLLTLAMDSATFNSIPTTNVMTAQSGIIDTDTEPLVATTKGVKIHHRKSKRHAKFDEQQPERQSNSGVCLEEGKPDKNTFTRSSDNNPLFDAAKYANMTEKQVRDELVRIERERKAQNRELEYLTVSEKELAKADLAKLNRTWRSKDPEYRLRDYDFRDLGILNDEEADLPRRLIRQIIRNRRLEAMVEQARAEGKEILQCRNCELMFPKGRPHRCFTTSWGRSKVNRGVPFKEDVVVSQVGRGHIKIGRQNRLDTDKCLKHYENLAQHRVLLKATKATVIDEGQIASRKVSADGGQTALDKSLESITVAPTEIPDEGEVIIDVTSTVAQEALGGLMTDNEDARVAKISIDAKLLAETMKHILIETRQHPFQSGSETDSPD